MIFTFTPLVWGAGADILSADGKTATLDTPQMRKAVDIYRTMVKKDLVPAGRPATPAPTSSASATARSANRASAPSRSVR